MSAERTESTTGDRLDPGQYEDCRFLLLVRSMAAQSLWYVSDGARARVVVCECVPRK